MKKMPSRNGGVRVDYTNTLLVECNALYKRSYSATQDQYNYNGQKIGALYQFLTKLRQLMKAKVYHNVVVFWDGEKSGKLRYNLYPYYKANRNKNYEEGTIPDDEDELLMQVKVKNYLEELGIKQFWDSEVEADDFIAHYCLTKKDNERIVIVTSDRDICQLIRENIWVYILDKKSYFDTNKYTKEFGYPPSNIKTIKILTGDVSDNIKGVKGLGQKGLFSEFPELRTETLTVEDIINLATEKQDKRLNEKKKALKKYDNIINGITEGSQGNSLYLINEKIIDLDNPLIPNSVKENVNEFIECDLDMSDRDLKHVIEKMLEDGLDSVINRSNFVEYLLPFKEYQDRYKLLIK